MSTVPRFLTWIAGVAVSAAVVPLVAPTPAAAQECASSADAAGCPFRCIGSTDFSGAKPTPLGASICQTIGNLATIAQQIGDQATTFVQPAQQELDALVAVTLEGAVNTTSIQTYNTALQRTDVIEGRITDLLGDPVCGSEAALNELRQFFIDQASNLVAAGQIAGSMTQAVAALQPALAEVQSIIVQLQQIAANAAERGPEAQKQYEILMKAMQDLKTQLEGLAALDAPGAVIAGAELVGSVGPFLTNCAGCTSALTAAVSSLVTGMGTATGSGAACPETVEAAGGTCWGLLGFPVGLTASTLAGALASPPCAAAAEGIGQMSDYLEKIGKFVSTSAKLAQGIGNSVATTMTASQALVKLAQELGSESEPQLQSIATSLNTTADAINASSAIMATQVAPKVATLAGSVVQQIGTGAVTMATCYNKLHAVAAAVAGDVMAGVNDLVVATAHLVDGGQVMTNIATQGQSAGQKASSYATTEFNKLRTERNRIHDALWGVSWPNVPSFTATTLTHLAAFANPATTPSLVQLGSDIVALETATAAVVPKAVVEGKKAFLDLDGDQEEAGLEFDLAGGLAQSGLTKLNTPSKFAVSAMTVPSVTIYATIDLSKIGTFTQVPRTTVEVLSTADRLAERLREIREVDVIQKSPDGRPVSGGTECLSCPRDFTMTEIWQSMEQAGVREQVSIRLYNRDGLVADLGTHSLARGDAWTAMPTYVSVSPREQFSDPASGCGYRVVVAGSTGRPLAETETCLKRN